MEVILKNEQQNHSNPHLKLQNIKMRSFSAQRIILVQAMATT